MTEGEIREALVHYSRLCVERGLSNATAGNISMRLGRPLQWDPTREVFVHDDEANQRLRREQRQGYEIA